MLFLVNQRWKEIAGGKKLFMLWTCTRTVTEPDAMLKYTIHMDDCHVVIPKQVVILWTQMT